MVPKNKQFKFSTFAIIIGWIIFTVLVTIEGILIISLWVDKAYIAVGFLMLLVSFISYEAFPKLFRFTKFYIKNEPALILTKDKLIDNVNNQIYDWGEIKKIQYNFSYPANHISIEIKHPAKFIKKEHNSYNRLIMKLNTKFFDGTFSLKPRLINGQKKDIVNSLNEFLKNSNTHNSSKVLDQDTY